MWLPLSLGLWLLASCTFSGGGEGHDGDADDGMVDSLDTDSLAYDPYLVDDEEVPQGVDELFDDFMYTFTTNRHLQMQRVAFPLNIKQDNGEVERIDRRSWAGTFDFMQGDYYTVLFNNAEQIDIEKSTDLQNVQVERIDLNEGKITSYDFSRQDGRWMLAQGRHGRVEDDALHDFLNFYGRFCTDSVYMAESIAQPLEFSLMDPEDEENYITGTIDVDQWSAFDIELPSGVITNMRYGQTYDNPNHMVLQKCAGASGSYEVFTFAKENGHWRLVKYEN